MHLFYFPIFAQDEVVNWVDICADELSKDKKFFESVTLVQTKYTKSPIEWIYCLLLSFVYIFLNIFSKNRYIKTKIVVYENIGFTYRLSVSVFYIAFQIKKIFFYKTAKIALITGHSSYEVRLFQKYFKVSLTIGDICDFLDSRHLKSTVAISNIVIANSRPLFDLCRTKKKYLISAGYFKNKELSSQRENFEYSPKTVIFIGTIDSRINYKLLSSLLEILPDYFFIFYGIEFFNRSKKNINSKIWRNNRVFELAWNKILSKRNIKYVKVKNQDELSKIKVTGSIGVIMYDLKSKFNQYCHPVKFYNYLNYHLPVISVPLNSIAEYEGKNVFFSNDPISFAKLIKKYSGELMVNNIAAQQTHELKSEQIKKIIKENVHGTKN